jgi:hypothetical protein
VAFDADTGGVFDCIAEDCLLDGATMPSDWNSDLISARSVRVDTTTMNECCQEILRQSSSEQKQIYWNLDWIRGEREAKLRETEKQTYLNCEATSKRLRISRVKSNTRDKAPVFVSRALRLEINSQSRSVEDTRDGWWNAVCAALAKARSAAMQKRK